MFARKTLLVIGAGASKEANMPTGEELATTIADLFPTIGRGSEVIQGDGDFLERFSAYAGSQPGEFHAAGQIIKHGIRHFRSIDNFIFAHKHNEIVAKVGKLAIVYSILRAERASKLWPLRNRIPEFGQLEPTWYPLFGDILREGLSKSDLEGIFQNLTIICFNYDRCIEEYLVHWLGSAFAISPAEARALVDKNLSILHPYGSISPEAEFGADPRYLDLRAYAEGIKTYTEQIEDPVVLAKIRDAVAGAETVVFLGFGYNKQNMELLMPVAKPRVVRTFASAFGFSDADAEDIAGSIKSLFRQSSAAQHMPVSPRTDLTCAGLFKFYRRTLSG